MKKLMIICVVCAMLFGMAGCVSESKKSEEDTTKNTSANKKPDKQPDNSEPEPSETEPVVKVDLDIVRGTAFNDGIALVLLSDRDYLTAIDEQGKELFTIDKRYSILNGYGHKAQYTGFFHGLIFLGYIHDSVVDYVICDKKGNIYLPEAYGGTHFENSVEACLPDGLIVIKNEDKGTMGVLDTDFQWLVPMSKEFKNAYDDMMNAYDHYYNGYILRVKRDSNMGYLNLRTGETGIDLREVEVKRESDLWFFYDMKYVIDARTGETVFQLDDVGYTYGNSYGTHFYFSDGQYLLMDRILKDSKYEIRYSVVGENGEYLVEPVCKEINELGIIDPSVSLWRDTLLLSYDEFQSFHSKNGVTEKEVATKWETRDFSGNILGSFQIPTPESDERHIRWIANSEAVVVGSIIMVTYEYLSYHIEYEYLESEFHTEYFTLEFEPLFS